MPLRWRREVALAVYLYPRLGELRVLPWEDVDLEHGSIHIHRALDRVSGKDKATKTGHPRRLNIEPNLLPLLKAMHEESGGEGMVCSLPSMRDMARGLRRWLHHAGVKRAELHESTPTRKAMTFHDLRATGIRWMAIRGDAPQAIQARAGHFRLRDNAHLHPRSRGDPHRLRRRLSASPGGSAQSEQARLSIGQPAEVIGPGLWSVGPGFPSCRNHSVFSGVDGTRTRAQKAHRTPRIRLHRRAVHAWTRRQSTPVRVLSRPEPLPS